MVAIASLWVPILLSAVLVFVVSSLVHMVFQYHKPDYRAFPDEDKVTDAMRGQSLTPGKYVFPHCPDMKAMASPDMIAKYVRGPVGYAMIIPSGAPAMGKLLGLWFGYCVLVGLFVAYVAGHTVAPGAHYLAVFRVTGTVAFMAYGLSQIEALIWKGEPLGSVWKYAFDGLLYSLVTAGAFGWLWPR